MASLKEMREAAIAWAAKEKADIASGRKKAPDRVNFKDLGEKIPGSTAAIVERRRSSDDWVAAVKKKHVMPETKKPLKTALVRETATPSARKNLASMIRSGRSGGVKLSTSGQAAAETGEAQQFVGQMKPNKAVNMGDPGRQGAQVTRDLHTPQKDLGRATVNTIARDPEGAPSLLKLAKSRAAKGQSVAGKPGNLEGSRQSLSNSLRSKAGKLGGKLGAYGMVKGIVEGAETLRKMKSGAYDLTPEGTAKPKKGVVES